MQAGQVISGAILIVTTERLTQGQTGRDADIVTYQGRDYRVTFVDPYTAYGAGFVQAHCELLPFDGEFRLSNNTSTERGWLIPTSGDPDYDEALDRLLSQWMRNVSGLSAGWFARAGRKSSRHCYRLKRTGVRLGLSDGQVMTVRHSPDRPMMALSSGGMKRLSVWLRFMVRRGWCMRPGFVTVYLYRRTMQH